MKIVGLSGSKVGSKTRIAMEYTIQSVKTIYPEADVTLIDLADYEVQFSDGRYFLDYEGDTKFIAQTLMDAHAIIFGTPIFQASIPAPLKNIFDLLPGKAFQHKAVSMLVTAGSAKHYLVPEQQLKPILSFMNAQIVPTYVFIEEKDFYKKEIVNDDVLLRIDKLVEDTLILADSYTKVREAKEKGYSFINRKTPFN